MKLVIIILLISYSLGSWAQSMGLTSAISMQSSANGQAAPKMLTMDMQQFASKLKAARTYIDQGDYEAALEHLQAAKKIKHTGKLFEYFGDAYTANREAAKAITAYKKAYQFYLQKKNLKALENIKNTLRFYKVQGF